MVRLQGAGQEVDDLVLEVLPKARVYIQIKHGLDAGAEFASAIGQLSRQFAEATFNRRTDRLVIVTDGSASGTIRLDLPKALSWFHSLPKSTPLIEFPHGKGPEKALDRVKKIFHIEYTAKRGAPLDDDWREFLKCVELTVLNPLDGSERETCIESLNSVVGSRHAVLAWTALCDLCLDAGRLRRPIDVATAEETLQKAGVRLSLTEGGQTSSIAAAVAALNRHQLQALEARHQYDGSLYIGRSQLDESFQSIGKDGKKVLLLTSGSGQGKTTWCAFQCDTEDAGTRIFIPAEAILTTDQHLRDTLTRMLRSEAEDEHRIPFAPAEVKNWLESAAAITFIDGLDRAAVTRNALRQWIQTTAFEAASFAGCVVMTTRPEILDLTFDVLGDGVLVAGLGDFSEFEAVEVALKLGIPELARYRHPRLMSRS